MWNLVLALLLCIYSSLSILVFHLSMTLQYASSYLWELWCSVFHREAPQPPHEMAFLEACLLQNNFPFMHFYVSRLRKLLNIFSSPFQMLKYPYKETGYERIVHLMKCLFFFQFQFHFSPTTFWSLGYKNMMFSYDEIMCKSNKTMLPYLFS